MGVYIEPSERTVTEVTLALQRAKQRALVRRGKRDWRGGLEEWRWVGGTSGTTVGEQAEAEVVGSTRAVNFTEPCIL